MSKRSARTPGKLDFIDKLVGQEIGAAPYLPGRPADRVYLVDLTAGDGEIGEEYLRKDGSWWYNCSPGILIRIAKKSRLPVVIDLYEIARNNYDRLIANLRKYLGEPWGINNDDATCWILKEDCDVTVRAFFGSGSNASVERMRPGDSTLILNDPYNVHTWAMRSTMVREIFSKEVPWCRTVSVMGCNPGGLHRLPSRDRQQWYGQLEALKESLPRYHDMCLAAIDGDASLWAYAATTAAKWRGETEKVIRAAFAEYDMTIVWWKLSPAEFRQLEDKLFTTRKERGE